MRIDEFEAIEEPSGSGSSVSYEEALYETVKVAALVEITKVSSTFSANTAQTVLHIAYPNRSINDLNRDWKKAYTRALKKEKFNLSLKVGKID
jgi:hypothetical protein